MEEGEEAQQRFKEALIEDFKANSANRSVKAEGTDLMGFIVEEHPIDKKKMSSNLLLALVEFNPECASLTEKKIEKAISNASGKRSDSAKLLQSMSINRYLGEAKISARIKGL